MRMFGPLVGLLVALALFAGPAHAAGGAQGRPSMGHGAGFEHVHTLGLDVEGRVLWLGAHTGLFRSEDGGRTWHTVPLSVKHPRLDVMAIGAHPTDSQIL